MYFESFLSIKKYRQQDNQHLKDTDYKTWITTKVIPRRLCVLLSRKDKNRIYFELVNQTLLTSRHLFWNFNPNSFAIISNNSGKGIEGQ